MKIAISNLYKMVAMFSYAEAVDITKIDIF